MNREYDAIVVGGGMAGLTSAAYLCRDGVRTLLVEKGDNTGGLVNTFWHQGFAFDLLRACRKLPVFCSDAQKAGIDIESPKIRCL